MKIKLLVKLGEIILGKSFSDEEPRADMYLPIWLLAFSIVLFVFGVAAGVYAILMLSLGATIGALIGIALGVLALLCWKNQSIVVLSDSTFEYTTFLGNKKLYRFQDITGFKKNGDSTTLFVGSEKVHIESCAVLSEKLIERIDKQLQTLDFKG